MNYTVVQIDIGQIYADSNFNCRGEILPSTIADLQADIKKHGIRDPLTVRPLPNGRYHLVAGHRRFMCATFLRLPSVPCFVREMTEAEAAILNLTENIQRQELNILQEARGVQSLIRAGKGENEIADDLAKSRGWVRIRLCLLTLPENIQQMAAANEFTQAQIVKASKYVDDPDKLNAFVKACKEAKEKGEEVPEPKKLEPPSPSVAKHRSPTEVEELIVHLYTVFGKHPFASKCLSWVIGETSSLTLEDAIEEECDKHEIRYRKRYVP
jgi:ParB family chromosome partitioning protein